MCIHDALKQEICTNSKARLMLDLGPILYYFPWTLGRSEWTFLKIRVDSLEDLEWTFLKTSKNELHA